MFSVKVLLYTVALKDTQGKKSQKANSGENIQTGDLEIPENQNETISSRESKGIFLTSTKCYVK